MTLAKIEKSSYIELKIRLLSIQKIHHRTYEKEHLLYTTKMIK
jgi:hypothetical protein